MPLLSSCLLSVAFLSAGTSAFFPISIPDDRQPSTSNSPGRKRFIPLPPFDNDTPDSPPTMNIKKMARRENKYNVIWSSEPTMEHSMAIHTDGHDYSYFSEIKFGSEGQKMFMLIDTGSSSTWVMGSNCTSAPCEKHSTFGKDSTTLITTDNEKTIHYGSGKVTGVVVNDTVSFAGFDLKFPFLSVVEASNEFNSYPMDGILGLGPGSARADVPAVMQLLKEQGLLKKTIIGINLQRSKDGATDGQITFGDVDKSKFTGEISYTDLISEDSDRWEIPAEDMFIDGQSLNFEKKVAIVDTGTSFLLMGTKDAALFHSKIKDAVRGNQDGYWVIPCSTAVQLEIAVSGVKHTISPKDYVGPSAAAKGMCHSLILGRPVLTDDQWVLGDVFLKNVYSIFDYDEHRLGLASRNVDDSESSSGSSPPPATISTPPTSSIASTTTIPPIFPEKSGINTASEPSASNPAQTASPTDPAVAPDSGTAPLRVSPWIYFFVLFSASYYFAVCI